MEEEMAREGVRRVVREIESRPQINPSVLVIVIILSVVFCCSGVLHILARCLGRRRAREAAGGMSSPSVSVRGQLQHLFSLHDAGVEQMFIDTLPVFVYGSIRGLKDSADCAVCLNEFQNDDKLRLLPKCKHAFHMECIDTWLLSNSTCPLCRRSLLPEAEPAPSPAGCAAMADAGPAPHGSFRGSFRASLRGSFRFLADVVAPPPPPPPPPPPSEREPAPLLQNPNSPPEAPTPPMTPGPTVCVTEPDGSEKTLRVELGKVNSFDSRRGAPSHAASGSRMARSYSMGSYEYVVGFASLGLRTQSPSKPTHRSTLSDSVPELASASHTPGQEETFWTSRGLETPHSLSRVREILTLSPGWLSSPLQQAAHIHHNEELDRGEIEVADAADEAHVVEIPVEQGKLQAPSLSLRLWSPPEGACEACSSQQTAPTDDVAVRDSVAAEEKQDKLWEVSVDVPAPGDSSSSSLKRLSSFNWLRGRSKRSLVYSAASPSSTDMQSTEDRPVT